MSSVAGILVRRGAEAAIGSFQDKKRDQPNGGLVALFIITILVIFLIFCSVSASLPVVNNYINIQ
jgi:hypothetical protein